VGANTTKAIAQTIYPFDVVYNTEVTLTPIASTNVSQAFVSGFNSDAPYGLTNFSSINNYSRIDPILGISYSFKTQQNLVYKACQSAEMSFLAVAMINYLPAVALLLHLTLSTAN